MVRRAGTTYVDTTGQPDPNSIDSPSSEWTMMEVYRDLPRDLRGGVIGLQRLYDKHLWKNKRERKSSFERRLKALDFSPFYWSSCEHLGGQPFTRDIIFSADTPTQLATWIDDVDGTGRDLRSLAWSASTESTGLGLVYLFVVFSERLNRPVMLLLPSSDVLDPWEPGAPVRVRFHDVDRDEKKPWVKRTAEQIWVLYDGDPTASDDTRFARFDVFEHVDRYRANSPWREEPTTSGTFKPQTTIPLFPYYTGVGSAMEKLPWVCMPSLHPLATMNRIHLNKVSDLDYGLHIANVPMLAAKGISEAEVKKFNVVSYDGMWYTEEPQGEFYHVEHTGAAFGVSEQNVDRMERRMEVFGLSPLLSKETNNVTATGRTIDLRRAVTTAQAWALGWEDTLTQAWRAMARQMNLRDTFNLELFTAFGAAEGDIERAKIIQQDYINGELEPEDYFPVMKSMGVYPQSFDADAAVARVKKRRADLLKRASEAPSKLRDDEPPETAVAA